MARGEDGEPAVSDEGGGASRSTDPAAGSSAATDVSLREHLAAIRRGDWLLAEERDRRYAEVSIEREKALKIKEEADRAALALDREIRAYKDEKANEFRGSLDDLGRNMATRRELISEVEKLQATIKPISDYVTSQQGGPRAVTTGSIVSMFGIVAILAGLYFGFHNQPDPVTPTVTVERTSP